MANELTVNPFKNGTEVVPSSMSSALVEVEKSRAVQETQAAMVIAKKFPRNQIEAMDRILNTCTRQSLAEHALYSYARGGTSITGPSIRLAEAIAQNWGNIQFGIRELEQGDRVSTVEAFAWDLETNTKQVKIFQVAHKRYTKKGSYVLEDPRDIYEMVANQGARRLRACILGVIPGDVIEAAVKQCDATLKVKADVTPERIAGIVEKFGEYGVTKTQIEARIQRRVDAITPAQMVSLGKVYNSLKDGMSVAADWFTPEEGTTATPERYPNEKPAPKKGVDALREKLSKPEPKEKKPEPKKTFTPPTEPADPGPPPSAYEGDQIDAMTRFNFVSQGDPDRLLEALEASGVDKDPETEDEARIVMEAYDNINKKGGKH